MADNIISMTGLELMTKIMVDGERDFSGITLQDGTDLSGDEDYKSLQRYLKNAKNLKQDPYNFSNASLRWVKAVGIYLPYLKAQRVDFTGADLREIKFYYGNFTEALFLEANLIKAGLGDSIFREGNFTGANLLEAHLRGSNLQGCNFYMAYLKGVWLGQADLRGAKNLDKAICLGGTHFEDTKISPEDSKIFINNTGMFSLEEDDLFN